VGIALAAIAVAVLFLAFSNGGNDNFKGVATLFGSGTATSKRMRPGAGRPRRPRGRVGDDLVRGILRLLLSDSEQV
jgi:hypothetical protein